MDAFELRDQLIAAMPDNWVGLTICTVYDEAGNVYSIRVAPDLSRVESDEEQSSLLDSPAMTALFAPVMQIWVNAPQALRNELARLLGSDMRLSDEDGVTLTRTELDLSSGTTETPTVE